MLSSCGRESEARGRGGQRRRIHCDAFYISFTQTLSQRLPGKGQKRALPRCMLRCGGNLASRRTRVRVLPLLSRFSSPISSARTFTTPSAPHSWSVYVIKNPSFASRPLQPLPKSVAPKTLGSLPRMNKPPQRSLRISSPTTLPRVSFSATPPSPCPS